MVQPLELNDIQLRRHFVTWKKYKGKAKKTTNKHSVPLYNTASEFSYCMFPGTTIFFSIKNIFKINVSICWHHLNPLFQSTGLVTAYSALRAKQNQQGWIRSRELEPAWTKRNKDTGFSVPTLGLAVRTSPPTPKTRLESEAVHAFLEQGRRGQAGQLWYLKKCLSLLLEYRLRRDFFLSVYEYKRMNKYSFLK